MNELAHVNVATASTYITAICAKDKLPAHEQKLIDQVVAAAADAVTTENGTVKASEDAMTIYKGLAHFRLPALQLQEQSEVTHNLCPRD